VRGGKPLASPTDLFSYFGSASSNMGDRDSPDPTGPRRFGSSGT
jgi:hypothetical protein